MQFFKNHVTKYFSPEKQSQIQNKTTNSVNITRNSTDTFQVIQNIEQKERQNTKQSFEYVGEDLNIKYYLIENQFFNDVIVQKDEQVHILTSAQWQKIIKTSGYEGISRKSLIFSILKGIPFQVRKDLWQVLAEVKEMKKLHKKNYQQLLQQNCKSFSMIEKDVPRSGMKDNKFEKQLKNILIAYSNLDPYGYTQGMNFICLSLLKLLSLQNDRLLQQLNFQIYQKDFQQRVFWIFVGIMYGKNWKECFQNNLSGAKRMISILEKLMLKYTPQIMDHIKKFDLDLNMCFTQYYLTLVIYNTPFGLAKRILDLFLLQGEKVIHSMIMKMIKICKQKILNINEMGELIKFFKIDMLEYCYHTTKQQKKKATSLQDFAINFFNLSPQ